MSMLDLPMNLKNERAPCKPLRQRSSGTLVADDGMDEFDLDCLMTLQSPLGRYRRGDMSYGMSSDSYSFLTASMDSICIDDHSDLSPASVTSMDRYTRSDSSQHSSLGKDTPPQMPRRMGRGCVRRSKGVMMSPSPATATRMLRLTRSDGMPALELPRINI
jgi:hypothetical protein